MKFEDVLPAFREGKKIRRKSWNPEVYFAYALTPETILEDDWEVVEEPKKPMVFEGALFLDSNGYSTPIYDSLIRYISIGKKYRITVEEME